MSNTRRIQRVLAEKNYNQDYDDSYMDYGLQSESSMHVKVAQISALYDYGINKEAFIAPLMQAAGRVAGQASNAISSGGAGAIMSGFGQGVKNMGVQAKNYMTTGAGGQAIKNNIATPISQRVSSMQGAGLSNAVGQGGTGILGKAKALGQAAWNNPYGQAAIVSGGIGAITSGLAPVQEGESRLGNMAKGAIGGAATGAAFTGLQRGMTAVGNKAFGIAPPIAPNVPV